MIRLVYIYYCIGIIGLTLISQSCTSNKILTTATNSEFIQQEMLDTTDFIVPQSDIILSFEIAKHSIIDSFGVLLDSIVSEPWEYVDQNLEIQLSRLDDAQLSAQDKRILITLPLVIQVTKKSFIGNMTAYGKLNVTFISELNIAPDWTFTTATTIEDYTWIQKPKFNLGVITLPIQWISDEVIKRMKNQLTKAIDDNVNENFDLPAQMLDLTQTLLQPYQLDSTVGGWIIMTADSTHLAPILDDEFYTISKLYTPVHMAVQSRQPETPDSKISLPPFSWKENMGDSTQFRLWVDMQYEYLTKIAKENFINHTFKNGNKEVKIEDLIIYGDNNRLFVKCQTSGSFNGEIIISGKPTYSAGILKAEDIEWDINTSNIFHKAASWLGKGYIHEQLNTMLVFDIEDYLDRTKLELSTKLEQLKTSKKVSVNIDWGPFDIDQLYTSEEALQGLLSVSMKVHVVIDDLRKLSFN